MGKTTVEKLVNLANVASGAKQGEYGYLLYQNWGLGRYKGQVWEGVIGNGGLRYSNLNSKTPRKTCNALRGRIIVSYQNKLGKESKL
jgi:hypothetical protein